MVSEMKDMFHSYKMWSKCAKKIETRRMVGKKGSKCAKKNEIKHRLAKGGHDLQKFQHARQSLEKCTWFYDLNCRCSYICKIAISAIPQESCDKTTISARSLNHGIIYASPCFMIPTVRACTRLTPHFMGRNIADILDSLLDLHFPIYCTTSI